MPVGDLGIPRGYIAFRGAIREAQEDQSNVSNERRERAFNDNLVRMNRPREQRRNIYEDNLFENYFSTAEVAQIERLLAEERGETGAA